VRGRLLWGNNAIAKRGRKSGSRKTGVYEEM